MKRRAAARWMRWRRSATGRSTAARRRRRRVRAQICVRSPGAASGSAHRPLRRCWKLGATPARWRRMAYCRSGRMRALALMGLESSRWVRAATATPPQRVWRRNSPGASARWDLPRACSSFSASVSSEASSTQCGTPAGWRAVESWAVLTERARWVTGDACSGCYRRRHQLLPPLPQVRRATTRRQPSGGEWSSRRRQGGARSSTKRGSGCCAPSRATPTSPGGQTCWTMTKSSRCS
mmetsp:Transcript_18480/g.57351  ORF Transcript_18480/g.57351 Transcript_18480/m.57351 type:complete len:237 (+) Transcript_18480:1508-2218(+)